MLHGVFAVGAFGSELICYILFTYYLIRIRSYEKKFISLPSLALKCFISVFMVISAAMEIYYGLFSNSTHMDTLLFNAGEWIAGFSLFYYVGTFYFDWGDLEIVV